MRVLEASGVLQAVTRQPVHAHVGDEDRASDHHQLIAQPRACTKNGEPDEPVVHEVVGITNLAIDHGAMLLLVGLVQHMEMSHGVDAG